MPSLLNQPAVHAFQRVYPEIKVISASGFATLAHRLLSERRGRKYVTDISINGSNSNYRMLYGAKSFDPIKPALILPDVTDRSLWWQGKHQYLDPEGEHLFIFEGRVGPGNVSYNSNLINPTEFKSFWDFLNPKWKGKIGAKDARLPGSGPDDMRFYYYNPAIGPKFIRRLFSEMGVAIFRSSRQGVDWLAKGRFALCFFFSTQVERAKQQGLPVDSFGILKEGANLVFGGGTIGLVNRAPHPNAAKLFINWFLSREGQLAAYQAMVKNRGYASESRRVDIPKDKVLPFKREKNVKYMDMSAPGLEWEPVLKVLEESLHKANRK